MASASIRAPFQTAHNTTRRDLSTPLRNAVESPTVTEWLPTLTVSRSRSPALDHLDAVRRSISNIKASHPERLISQGSPTRREIDRISHEIKGPLSLSDLEINTSFGGKQNTLFTREQAEELINDLLNKCNKDVTEIKNELLRDVNREFHYAYNFLNAIVQRVENERKRTQRIISRSNVANKLLRDVYVELDKQSALITTAISRIKKIEAQIKDEQEYRAKVQQTIEFVERMENTINSNAEKIGRQIKTTYTHLRDLRALLEQFLAQKETDAVARENPITCLQERANALHKQLGIISSACPYENEHCKTSKESPPTRA